MLILSRYDLSIQGWQTCASACAIVTFVASQNISWKSISYCLVCDFIIILSTLSCDWPAMDCVKFETAVSSSYINRILIIDVKFASVFDVRSYWQMLKVYYLDHNLDQFKLDFVPCLLSMTILIFVTVSSNIAYCNFHCIPLVFMTSTAFIAKTEMSGASFNFTSDSLNLPNKYVDLLSFFMPF